MSLAPVQVYQATMASGSDTAVVNFKNAFQRVYMQCPSMSTAAERSVYGSVDGTDYYQVMYEVASGVSAPSSMVIGSGVVEELVEIKAFAPYLKLVATAVVSGGGVYKFICT